MSCLVLFGVVVGGALASTLMLGVSSKVLWRHGLNQFLGVATQHEVMIVSFYHLLEAFVLATSLQLGLLLRCGCALPCSHLKLDELVFEHLLWLLDHWVALLRVL